jgi:GcrA cell cycle regulator
MAYAFWTPEQDTRLADFLRDGKSASEIGAELGVSRNAVVGRVHRNPELAKIGFARSPGKQGPRQRKSDKPRARPRIAVVSPSILFDHAPAVPLPEPVFIPGERHTVGRPILMLGHGECRWPVNDADRGELHLFCGAPADGSWCECHRRRSTGKGTESERTAPRVLLAAA